MNRVLNQRRYILRYLILSGIFHLAWEVLQLPLYSLWRDSTDVQIAFAVGHCTVGDLLIALVSLAAALLLTGAAQWPQLRYVPVAVATVLLGVSYTAFSEWRNTVVTQSWAYSALMPQLWGIGFSPLAQWVVIPSAVFLAARKYVTDVTPRATHL